MAYVRHKTGFGTGEIAVTARMIEGMGGYFEKGTVVEIVGISDRGYDLQDEYGNRVTETGFDSVEHIVKHNKKNDGKGNHCELCGEYIGRGNLKVCDKCASEYRF